MSRALRLRRGWRHPTEHRPALAKPSPYKVHRHDGHGPVGEVRRLPEHGRWYGFVFDGALRRWLPGWFKSRKTAVAAVLRADAEARLR